jgi:GNAT superfamily N-acetyltransferase
MTESYTIRSAAPEQDYARIAELMNTFERQVITAETLRTWDSRAGEGTIRRRLVAVDSNGHIQGYAVAAHDSWDKPGSFVLWVVVDPAERGKGIGAKLYDHALTIAQGEGAAYLSADVIDSDPASQRFAEKRGFQLNHHLFESTVDLRAFDETRFAGVIEGVQAGGIRLFSLADAGDTPEARHKLWQVNYQCYLDDPASSGEFPNFEEFNNIFNTSAWFRPEGQLLAADGEQVIGLSAVGHFRENNEAYNLMTGVMADYRGRKIALALKVLALRAAQSWGVDCVRTNNDSTNAPMLAINRKLGYLPQPGIYRMKNVLEG